MPFKNFVAGEEALAADVNTYLMGQTVARFTNAAQRTAQLPAPVTNQLSQLDDRPGVVQRYSGSAWADMGTSLMRRTYQAFGGIVAAPQELSLATFTMPFAGTVYLDALMRIEPGAGASAVAIVPLVDAGPTTVPVLNTPQWVGVAMPANNIYQSFPFSYKSAGVVAAGTACNLKVAVASNNGAMGFKLTHISSTVTLIPSEF